MRILRLTGGILPIVVVAGSTLGMQSRAKADFNPVAQPDAAYLAATSSLPVLEPDFAVLPSLADGTFQVAFSSDTAALSVPGTWTSWGSPPDVETATPRVLWSQGATSLGLTFSSPVSLFGLEVQPNTTTISPITATFFSFGAPVGSILLDVDGNGGAKLFGASSGNLFTSVSLSSTDDFGLAQLRYGGAVPEPGAMALLCGAGFTGWMVKKRRK